MECVSLILRPGERLYAAVAWLYVVLLPCHVRLAGPIYLHDLLIPFFVAALLQRGDWRRWLRLPDAWLAGFGVWCVLATLTRRPGWPDLYELGILGYMALLYAFFSRTALSPRGLWWYAAWVAAALWAVGVVQVLLGLVQTHTAYVGSTLAFLTRRYGFTFGNPNLLGSFCALPVACALLALVRQIPGSAGTVPPGQDAQATRRTGPARWCCGWLAGQGSGSACRRLLALAALLLALGVPLLLTASRHLLLSLALVLGALTALTPTPRRRAAGAASLLALALVFALFYLTVLFPFFPLQGSPPFINCRTPGMYMVHQAAYLKMTFLEPRTAVFGLGRTAVRQRYPEVVDPELARRVLHEYHTEQLIPSFLQYMDAHNDYLNLATAFGLPAVAALYAFFWLLVRAARRGGGSPVAALLTFAVLGLCLASLWDDLLSKRWIWVMLGLLAGAAWNGWRAASSPTATVPTP
jgi:hypothetical protein